MKMSTGLIGTVSGSTGGVTASHNKGGQYLRRRSIPVNSNTSFQQDVRNALSQMNARWNAILTPTQRTGWAVFASNMTVVDTLGFSIQLTGLQWYIKCNVPRVQAGAAVVDDAPVVFALTDLSPLTLAVTAASASADVTFNNTDGWANESGGLLLIFTSRPQDPTINYFKGPYRLAGVINGNAMTPPTSPATITMPFIAGPAGSSIFFRGVGLGGDGRPSSTFRGQSTV